jgi:hypothetical protein
LKTIEALCPPKPNEFNAHVGVTGFVRDVVEIALGILDLVVDRRLELHVPDRECQEDRLDRARRPEAMSRCALVDDTSVRVAFSSPSAFLITRIAAASSSDVEVPCVRLSRGRA